VPGPTINADGYFEKNPQDAYSVNNVTAKRDADGTVTIHFGGDPGQSNFLDHAGVELHRAALPPAKGTH